MCKTCFLLLLVEVVLIVVVVVVDLRAVTVRSRLQVNCVGSLHLRQRGVCRREATV